MVKEFIKELEEKKITVSFAGGKLKYSGPEEHVTPELLAKLKEYKSRLLKYYWPKECVNMMPVNTEGTKLPLTLLHAGPSNYTISDHMGKDQPFYGFFYIGSEGEKIRYRSLEEFSMAYQKQLQFIVPEGPYMLGGFSIGGNLAYEMAIQLQKQGHKVPLLVLVDSVLPGLRAKENTTGIYRWSRHKAKLVYHFGLNLLKKIYYGSLRITGVKLPKNQRRRYILWNYGRYLKNYKPSEDFHGEILLFKAEENTSRFEKLGWEKVCKKIELVTFPGFHGAMYQDKDSIQMISNKIIEHVKKYN